MSEDLLVVKKFGGILNLVIEIEGPNEVKDWGILCFPNNFLSFARVAPNQLMIAFSGNPVSREKAL